MTLLFNDMGLFGASLAGLSLFIALWGLVVLAIFSILLLILRPVILWYFKINKITEEQEKANLYLSKILDALEQQNDLAALRMPREPKVTEAPQKPQPKQERDDTAYMPR